MTWHVVHTIPNAEPVVNFRLRSDGFETLWLHYPETVRQHRYRGSGSRFLTKLRSYFPRYLFVNVGGGQGLYGINNTVGVSTVLYGHDGPLEVPETVMDDLRKRGDADGLLNECEVPKQGERLRFKAGEQVIMKDGPFAGFLAVVAIDTGERLKIWLEMFRGRVEVEARPDQVKPVVRSRQRVA